MPDVPHGYCQCGCGAKTAVARRTQRSKGWVKGEPLKRLPGHGRRNPGPRWLAEDRGYDTPCHIWQLYTMPNGYGRLGSHLAHRLAWQDAHGPIPDGLWVLHKCDVPSCVNPGHLFLGTPSENQDDCERKGRRRRPAGERHGHARLTWDDVRAIRASSDRPIDLARRYGVHPNTIHGVLKRRTWKE